MMTTGQIPRIKKKNITIVKDAGKWIHSDTSKEIKITEDNFYQMLDAFLCKLPLDCLEAGNVIRNDKQLNIAAVNLAAFVNNSDLFFSTSGLQAITTFLNIPFNTNLEDIEKRLSELLKKKYNNNNNVFAMVMLRMIEHLRPELKYGRPEHRAMLEELESKIHKK